MSVIDEYLSARKETKKKDSGIPGFTMNAPVITGGPSGDIGIEIEVEGYGLLSQGSLEGIKDPVTGTTWINQGSDGSLRGENSEYVFNGPCSAEHFPKMVNDFYQRFQTARARIVPSNRTSTHIHINVCEMKVNEITSMLGLWSIFEPVLINWCGETRKTNHFCLSNTDVDGFVSAWQNFLRTGSMRFQDGLKYSACNILTIMAYGSLEFRCAPLWTEADRPVWWGKFLYALREYAKANYQNPQNLAYALSERTGIEIFKDICDSQEGLTAFFDEVVSLSEGDEHTFNALCMQGFRNIQPVILEHPWHEWEEQIHREFVPNPFTATITTADLTRNEARTAREVFPAFAGTTDERVRNAD